jgi:hypothetical protein
MTHVAPRRPYMTHVARGSPRPLPSSGRRRRTVDAETESLVQALPLRAILRPLDPLPRRLSRRTPRPATAHADSTCRIRWMRVEQESVRASRARDPHLPPSVGLLALLLLTYLLYPRLALVNPSRTSGRHFQAQKPRHPRAALIVGHRMADRSVCVDASMWVRSASGPAACSSSWRSVACSAAGVAPS